MKKQTTWSGLQKLAISLHCHSSLWSLIWIFCCDLHSSLQSLQACRNLSIFSEGLGHLSQSFFLFAWLIVVWLAMTDSSTCKLGCSGLGVHWMLRVEMEIGLFFSHHWSWEKLGRPCPYYAARTLWLIFCLHTSCPVDHPPGSPCLFHIQAQTYLRTSLSADLWFYRDLRGLVTQNPKPLLFWLNLLWRKCVSTAAPNLELRINNTTNNFCFMGCIMWRLWKLLIFHKRSCGVSIMLGKNALSKLLLLEILFSIILTLIA